MDWWKRSGLQEDWEPSLKAGVDEHVVSRMREALASGAPCGDVKARGTTYGRAVWRDSHEA
jgi:hypothetical protein